MAVKANYSAIRAEYSAASINELEGEVTSISAIQPSPYGSEFKVSGAESRPSLTAMTLPDTGENISETLFVDSTSPQTAP